MSIFIKEFQSYNELQGYCGGTASPGLYFVRVDETKSNKPSQYFYDGINIVAISGSPKSSEVELVNSDSNFTTTTVEGALNELFQNVNDGKQVIATAIIDKGGNVTVANTFAELATAISTLSTNGGETTSLTKEEVVYENLESNSTKYIQLVANINSPENIVASVYVFIASSNGVSFITENFNLSNSFELNNIDKDVYKIEEGVIKLNDIATYESQDSELIEGENYFRFSIDFNNFEEIVSIL